MKYFQGLGYDIFQPIFQMEYVLFTATNNCTNMFLLMYLLIISLHVCMNEDDLKDRQPA